jgi:hypothetical protein
VKKKRYVLIVLLGLVLLIPTGIFLINRDESTQDFSEDLRSLSREAAFRESYLDSSMSTQRSPIRKCQSCHEGRDDLDRQRWKSLQSRSQLSQAEWAKVISLQTKCGVCHVVPLPPTLPTKSWSEAINRMDRIAELRGTPKLNEDEREDVLHYYYTFSRERFPPITEDPDPANSPLKFSPSVFGNAMRTNERPVVGHVQIVDLDRDGHSDVLVCDTDNSLLTWVHRSTNDWHEDILATIPCPAHTQVVTNKATGKLDIVVACQSLMAPTDDPVGSVVLLLNDGKVHFEPLTLLENVPRVADVEPGDFDGDGDLDFVVGAYGYIKSGEVGWLENNSGKYIYHVIVKRAGAIHVLPTDLNGDGKLDFLALFAQEHEQVSAFLGDGKGNISEHVLFKAATPSFGSSGMELVDLDGDGDMDILYTNGDNMDLSTMIPRPYHGVQWLENKGDLNFEWHDIYRFYGAYCAVAGDLNRDGELDIVVTSMFNDWADPKRDSIIWLENDGRQNFKPHGIAREPIYLISAALGDLNEDGWLDIVTSGMHAFPPTDRMSRVTLWTNSASFR